jgi:hypothetical protein
VKNIFLLLFVLLPLVSCQSSGQAVSENQGSSISISPGNKSGSVDSWEIKNRKLILPSENIQIIFNLEGDKNLNQLNFAETYSYSQHKRPDGPVAILALKDQDLLAWIGDGIRSGMGPEGLSIVAETGVSTVGLKSDDTSWSIPVEEEVLIQWRDSSWLIYVSGVTKGSLMDQPPFKADIIILRLSSD